MAKPEQPVATRENIQLTAETAGALQEIEVEHYRTEELVETISQLISIPSFIMRIIKCMSSFVVVSWIVIPWVFGEAVGFGWLIPLMLYGTLAALVVGTAVGITYSLGRAFGNMIELADLTLHVTDQVIHDFRSLAGGKKSWPSPRQFVVYVYDFVIIPSVEIAFQKVFWIFGTFVVWLYKKTFGRIVRYMLRFTPAGNIAELPDPTLPEHELDDEQETARHTWINTTRQWVQSLGVRLLWTMLFPLILACLAIASFAVVPLVVAYNVWVNPI